MNPSLDGLAKRFRQNSATGVVASRASESDHAHDRHTFVVHPLIQTNEAVFSRLGVVPTLEGGRGAAENNGGFFAVRAQDRHVAGIVAR
ncbi:MAG: hypothetical protein ACKOLA_00235, partial [Spartobacteria bacterium]